MTEVEDYEKADRDINYDLMQCPACGCNKPHKIYKEYDGDGEGGIGCEHEALFAQGIGCPT